MDKAIRGKDRETQHECYREKCSYCGFLGADSWGDQADYEATDEEANEVKQALYQKPQTDRHESANDYFTNQPSQK